MIWSAVGWDEYGFDAVMRKVFDFREIQKGVNAAQIQLN